VNSHQMAIHESVLGVLVIDLPVACATGEILIREDGADAMGGYSVCMRARGRGPRTAGNRHTPNPAQSDNSLRAGLRPQAAPRLPRSLP
jgi:hypothetical protein